MNRERRWLIVGIALSPLLAAPAAVPVVAGLHQGTIDPTQWLFHALTALAVAWLVYAGTRSTGASSSARLTVALLLAALSPLAARSSQLLGRADLALLCTAVSAALWFNKPALAWAGSALLAGVACACDPAALLWPVAAGWAAVVTQAHRGSLALLCAAGAIGAAARFLVGEPLNTSWTYREVVYALHDDFMVLLPLALPGLAGWLQARVISGDASAPRAIARHWGTLSLLALLPMLAGVALNPRLVLLGLIWWAPVGLDELRGMMARSSPAVLRRLGWACTALGILLLWTGWQAWKHGALMCLYVVGG